MKKHLRSIALFSILCVAAPSANAHDANLRIGAWNAEADRVTGGDRLIPKRRIPRIAEIIAALDPDVLAISEIAPDSRLTNIKNQLAIAGRCYRSKMISQSSKLNVAFLFKCGVQASNARLVPDSGYGPTDNRKARAVDFTGIAVHFKSGGGSTNQDLRKEQVESVWKFLEDDVLPSQDDVLIMGDYNMTPTRDPENFDDLNPDNVLRFISSEELKPRDGFSKVFSHISSNNGGNLLDGMSINRNKTTEYVLDSVKILPMDLFVAARDLEDFARRYSDHLPILAEFKNEDAD